MPESRPTPPPPVDSVALLQEVKTGSQAALQQLLVRHLGPLRAFVRLQVGPVLRARESESDVVQHVCVEVLQRADHFAFRGETQFRGWLYGAVLNVVRDRERFHKAQRRSPAREVEITDPDALLVSYRDVSSPSSHLQAAEVARQLEAAFERLPPHYAEVLALFQVVKLSRQEVAERLGISPEAVSKRHKSAVMRLSHELRPKH